MSVLYSMTDEEKAKYRAQKLKEIRDYNADLIKDLGISLRDFNMKTPFYDDQGRLVVGMFPSEFKTSKGFYFELIDYNLNPSDPDRKVYRLPPNSEFEKEYELNHKGSYNVFMEELRVVNRDAVAISKYPAVSSVDDILETPKLDKTVGIAKVPAAMEDAPYSEMTIRDYYAIHTGKPVSAKSWLNDLIKNK